MTQQQQQHTHMHNAHNENTHMMAAKRQRASPATVSVPEFWSASPTRTVPPIERRRPAILTHEKRSRP
jgi:hypothetical protein